MKPPLRSRDQQHPERPLFLAMDQAFMRLIGCHESATGGNLLGSWNWCRRKSGITAHTNALKEPEISRSFGPARKCRIRAARKRKASPMAAPIMDRARHAEARTTRGGQFTWILPFCLR